MSSTNHSVPSPSWCAAGVLLIATAACSNNNPTQPTPGSNGSSPTASVTVPRPLTPANNASIRNVDQPVTLLVQNAIATQSGATYTFEVATDGTFATKAQTNDAVAEGSGGQTSVKLDALPAAHDYFWHVRATEGGTTGVFGATYKFTVGPEKNVTFTVGGSDVTSGLQQYGVVLGTDLSGSETAGMLSLGGGVAWPAWRQLVVDFQYRYGHVFTSGEAITVNRAGVGIGVRF